MNEQSWQHLIRNFHVKFGLTYEDRPTLANENSQLLRIKLINEELMELTEAYMRGNLRGVADALGDLVYVVVGTAVEHGLDMDGIFREVHRSNMSKLGGYRDEVGKWIKPDTYTPPDLTQFLDRARWAPGATPVDIPPTRTWEDGVVAVGRAIDELNWVGFKEGDDLIPFKEKGWIIHTKEELEEK